VTETARDEIDLVGARTCVRSVIDGATDQPLAIQRPGRAREDGPVKIELLVVDDCPNEAPARDALRRALDRTGFDAPITTMIIADDDQAQKLAFHGSPSFYVDGQDLFPVPHVRPGLACRVYPTTTGLRGVPDDRTLTTALTNRTWR